MEIYQIKNLTFTYPGESNPALCGIDLSVNRGEFITICGKSGCGKTTLLRLLKPALAPHGELDGSILFGDKSLDEHDTRGLVSSIAFVMQNPDNQIVTDKVWHELAFGLESLGCKTAEIRTRVSEMASYFGIQTWFHKKITELSGGQKQLLNLASIMVMQPKVIILDEPTSQLDPIAAQEFLKTLEKINRELGTTIILSEHRLEDAFPASDRIIVMDKGKIISDASPCDTGAILKSLKHDMCAALPAPMRIWGMVENSLPCPVTVREGREWLENFSSEHRLNPDVIPHDIHPDNTGTAVELKDVWFRYGKELPDAVCGVSMKVNRGELYAIVGGNGTGKTSTLSLIGGLNRPHRGDILIFGEKIENITDLHKGKIGILPQNPQALFVKKTVRLDLLEILSDKKLSNAEKDECIKRIASLCRIEALLNRHPYDLSGGEQQRAALAKVLLQSPKILLLDEPTKGMDAHFKKCFAEILHDLKKNGVTVIMVSHDIEFCAEHADRCAMFFDGSIAGEDLPREFFTGKSFYTTSANRMARGILPDAILSDDVVLACGGNPPQTVQVVEHITIPQPAIDIKSPSKRKKLSTGRLVTGCLFAILFVLTYLCFDGKYTDTRNVLYQLAAIAEAAIYLLCFIPSRTFETVEIQQSCDAGKPNKRTLLATLVVLILVPVTIFAGKYYLGDKKFYFISLLIIIETLLPFMLAFESRRHEARELIVISVLCALAVAGRAAFYMVPYFKPVIAIIIISAVCLGSEAGFLIGVVTAFVSNFFFGQGPWTPWQMFSFGLVGFLAGILFRKGLLRKTRTSLAIFGAIASTFIFGIIMNCANVLIYPEMFPEPNLAAFVSSCVLGFPFDLIHGASTAMFVWFLSEPMIDKIERTKSKYGIKI